MTIMSRSDVTLPAGLLETVHTSQRFVVCGHARPDGDAIGSVMAMTLALRILGKDVRAVSADPPPSAFAPLPGMERLEELAEVDADGAVVVIMESGSLDRTGVTWHRPGAVLNIDHHLGNTAFGSVNWIDESAAACGEMVADLIDALHVPWTPDIAAHLYVALLTDTGSFRHSHITRRSFELARRCVEAGADPVALAQQVYDSYSMGRLRLVGELLHTMQSEADDRIAVLTLTPEVHARTGSTADESDGLINLPFMAQPIRVVLLLRQDLDGRARISLRSKGAVDIRAVAQEFGGGGHLNASGFTSDLPLETLRERLLPLLTQALARAGDAPPAAAAP
jgi:bifunctional oligoribonuclease and PAP phosphatase NrnA